MKFDSVDELVADAEDPDGAMEKIARSSGLAGKKLALTKLRPKMEPVLLKQGLAWEAVLLALVSPIPWMSL